MRGPVQPPPWIGVVARAALAALAGCSSRDASTSPAPSVEVALTNSESTPRSVERAPHGAELDRAKLNSTPLAGREDVDPRFALATEIEAAARRERILAELGELRDPAWAGSYYFGDELGFNVRVWLAPKNGFVFEWWGFSECVDRNFGAVREVDGCLELEFEFPNEPSRFGGLAPELVPVRWGARRYLATFEQCQRIAHIEPRTRARGEVLLRAGDWEHAATGVPQFPPAIAKHLDGRAVHAEVTEVAGSASETIDGRRRTRTTVTLDVGADFGVERGETFRLLDCAVERFATVVAVADHTSLAEIEVFDGDHCEPRVGWKCSSARE